MGGSPQGRRAGRISLGLTFALVVLSCVPAQASLISQLIKHVEEHVGHAAGKALEDYIRHKNKPDVALSAQIMRCAVEAKQLDQQQDRLTTDEQKLASTPITSPGFLATRARHAHDQQEFERATSAYRGRCDKI